MLKHDDQNGYTFIDEQTGKAFPLMAMHCLGGYATSDIIVIWDDEHGNMFNWFYGETCLLDDPQELETFVAAYIKSGDRI